VVAAGLLVGVVRGLTVFVYPAAAEASMFSIWVRVPLHRPRGILAETVAWRD
jgi:branched-chain amino acid transport system permease protein